MRKPLTLAEIVEDGPPVRVRDLVALTGLCEATIRQDLRLGVLKGRRRIARPNSPYLIDRQEVRRYLVALGLSGAQTLDATKVGNGNPASADVTSLSVHDEAERSAGRLFRKGIGELTDPSHQ